MQSRLDAREELSALALTALRIGSGIIMAAHGWQKLTGFAEWQGNVERLGLPMPEVSAVLATIAELGGGIALALGALTPLAALGVVIVMTVAIVTVHAGNGPFVSDGGWELALLMGLVALFFVMRGAGPYSIDALVRDRVRSRRSEQQREERIEPGARAPMGGPA